MERVTDPADPRRCLGTTPTGQCWYVKVDGRDHCREHSGLHDTPDDGARELRLTKVRDRIRLAALSESDHIKSLREMIGMTRMMVEDIWNSCPGDTPAERQLMYGRIRLHVGDLQKLIKDCFLLEERLGALLSKPTLLQVGQNICIALITRLEGLPGYEQLCDVLEADVVRIINEARNDAKVVPVPALPPPDES